MKVNNIEIKGLYHNHSKYSKLGHGKNTIEEMLIKAKNLGLSQFAITDHAPKHLFGIRKKNIQKARFEIDQFNKNYYSLQLKNQQTYTSQDNEVLNENSQNIEFVNKDDSQRCFGLLGLECNLLGFDGKCDFPEDLGHLFDIRLLGFHLAGKFTFNNFFNMVVKQVVFKKLDIEKNTDAYISAIKKYKIDIVTHPNEHIQVNIKRLAEACAQNNCYLEINERHFRYQKQDIEECLKTNVKFIVSSDAHSIQQIDKLNKVFEKIKEFNIPLERIANFDKFPDFRNKYKTEKIENIKNNNQNRKQYIEENEL